MYYLFSLVNINNLNQPDQDWKNVCCGSFEHMKTQIDMEILNFYGDDNERCSFFDRAENQSHYHCNPSKCCHDIVRRLSLDVESMKDVLCNCLIKDATIKKEEKSSNRVRLEGLKLKTLYP